MTAAGTTLATEPALAEALALVPDLSDVFTMYPAPWCAAEGEESGQTLDALGNQVACTDIDRELSDAIAERVAHVIACLPLAVAALGLLIEHAQPEGWGPERDPDEARAWTAAFAALRALGLGRIEG